MTAFTVHRGDPVQHRSFHLTPLHEYRTEQQPDVVLPASEVHAMIATAHSEDVSGRGCFSAGPGGIQVWDGPWNGEGGRVGTAQHLGSVDWTWDSPVGGYVTIYRVLVTAAGSRIALSTQELLDAVLDLRAAGPLLPGPRSAP